MTPAAAGYAIKLPQFEGPFDLLLFFIQRDELDIYDIPIAKITDDFLAYIQQATEKNIELASEFIVVAATLMRIKAKMLIPRRDIGDNISQEDPRRELVQQLLEYKRYKDVLEDLRLLEQERAKMFERSSTEMLRLMQRCAGEAELYSLTPFHLLHALHRVLDRWKERTDTPLHEIVPWPYTVEQQQQHILRLLSQENHLSFDGLFAACQNRMHAIFTFLALLDLVLLRQVQLEVGSGVNDFWVRPTDREPAHPVRAL